eukprot:5178337-Pyramimonas_sp.AAC.1
MSCSSAVSTKMKSSACGPLDHGRLQIPKPPQQRIGAQRSMGATWAQYGCNKRCREATPRVGQVLCGVIVRIPFLIEVRLSLTGAKNKLRPSDKSFRQQWVYCSPFRSCYDNIWLRVCVGLGPFLSARCSPPHRSASCRIQTQV